MKAVVAVVVGIEAGSWSIRNGKSIEISPTDYYASFATTKQIVKLNCLSIVDLFSCFFLCSIIIIIQLFRSLFWRGHEPLSIEIFLCVTKTLSDIEAKNRGIEAKNRGTKAINRGIGAKNRDI